MNAGVEVKVESERWSPVTVRTRAASAPSRCGARRCSSARSVTPIRSIWLASQAQSMLGSARRAEIAEGRASASTVVKGAIASSAEGRASASIIGEGAYARSAEERACASTFGKGRSARSAEGRASAGTPGEGAIARSAAGRASASARSADGRASTSTVGEEASARRAKQTKMSLCRRISRSFADRAWPYRPCPVSFCAHVVCAFWGPMTQLRFTKINNSEIYFLGLPSIPAAPTLSVTGFNATLAAGDALWSRDTVRGEACSSCGVGGV